MSDWNGRTAVVTGGNSGIGLATARKLAALGANVVIMGRDARSLEAARGELGPRARSVQGDVSRLADLDRLYAETRAAFGRIDFLFVNAGIAEFRPAVEVDEAFYDRLFDANVKGAFFTLQKALPLLADGASVVFNTSVVGSKGFPGATVYSATKAALRSFARTFAAELAARNIRVNAVSPGPIETPIFAKMGLSQEAAKDMLAGFAAQVPLKRPGSPDEIAEATLYLAGAGFVTGAELSVDGGLGQV